MSVNATSTTNPLIESARQANAHIALRWLENGRNVNEKDDTNRTALHHAIISNDRKSIQWLLTQNVSINNADNNGETPLTRAVMMLSNDIVQLLLDHGADVNMRCSDGVSPLMLAALYRINDLASLSLLLDHGADVNTVSEKGITPLSMAIHNRNPNNRLGSVSLLLDRGANVNTADCTSMTPLMKAALRGDNAPIAHLLLKHGAIRTIVNHCDVTAPVHFGITALSIAAFSIHSHVVRLLIVHAGPNGHQDNDEQNGNEQDEVDQANEF